MKKRQRHLRGAAEPSNDFKPGRGVDGAINLPVSSQTGGVTVVCTITDSAGAVVKQSTADQSISAGSSADAMIHLVVDHPHLWDGRRDPYLYLATVEVRSGDTVLDRVAQPVGFRYFTVDPDRGLILNGHPYDYHGVNYHESRAMVGSAQNPAMDEEDNQLICEMGCTGVRMAHYQHNDYEYSLCDRSGLIVWAELALVTADRKVRKDAFYFYKACWSDQPFVYITSRRFDKHPAGNTTLKVYSNCDSVTLHLNGQTLGEKTSAEHIFRWDVELPEGEVNLQANAVQRGIPCNDSIHWKVSSEFQPAEHAAFIQKPE